MGLDNGIQLITKQKIDLDDWDIMPEYVHIEFDEFNTNEYKDGYYYDICYWRKCSCIRNAILNNIFNEYNSEGGIFEIDKSSQIEQIQDILIYHLLNPEAWRSAIWTLDEACRNIAQCIINLTWLKNFMAEHVGIRIIFYDSF